MKYRRIVAIIPSDELDHVEEELSAIGVPGMTVGKVSGIGEYRNYYTKDMMSECRRVDVFTEVARTREIVNTIAMAVGKNMKTDGIIAVLPVEEFIHIREYCKDLV